MPEVFCDQLANFACQRADPPPLVSGPQNFRHTIRDLLFSGTCEKTCPRPYPSLASR